MANYAVWNNRLRHEWLAKPQKGKYLSRRDRERCGLQDALDREASSSEKSADEAQGA
jgi:hypothetical protein